MNDEKCQKFFFYPDQWIFCVFCCVDLSFLRGRWWTQICSFVIFFCGHKLECFFASLFPYYKDALDTFYQKIDLPHDSWRKNMSLKWKTSLFYSLMLYTFLAVNVLLVNRVSLLTLALPRISCQYCVTLTKIKGQTRFFCSIWLSHSTKALTTKTTYFLQSLFVAFTYCHIDESYRIRITVCAVQVSKNASV